MHDPSQSRINPLTVRPSVSISLMSHPWLGMDDNHCLLKTLQRFPFALGRVQSLLPAHASCITRPLPDSPDTQLLSCLHSFCLCQMELSSVPRRHWLLFSSEPSHRLSRLQVHPSSSAPTSLPLPISPSRFLLPRHFLWSPSLNSIVLLYSDCTQYFFFLTPTRVCCDAFVRLTVVLISTFT